MEVNWEKWILELLPPLRRGSALKDLCTVLILPIIRLYDLFIDWRAKMRIKSIATPQVCMLKKIIREETGVLVEIDVNDGKPIDFIVKAAFTNIDLERKLFALIERYKMAGKSYSYENANVYYEQAWGRYICEQRTINKLLMDFDFGGTDVSQSCYLTCSYPLASPVWFKIYFINKDKPEENAGWVNTLIPEGYTHGLWYIKITEGKAVDRWEVNPEHDLLYDYIAEVRELNRAEE